MSESESIFEQDAELLEWGKEIDEIMTAAVKGAIAENKALGLTSYVETEEKAKSPRVAED